MKDLHPSQQIFSIGDKYFGSKREHAGIKYALVAFNHNTVALQNLTNPQHEVTTIPRFYFVETFRHEKRPEYLIKSIDRETLFSVQSTILETMRELQLVANLSDYDLNFIYNTISLELANKFGKK